MSFFGNEIGKYNSIATISNPNIIAYDFNKFLNFDSSARDPLSDKFGAQFPNTHATFTSYYMIDEFKMDNSIRNINEYNRYILVNGSSYTLTPGFYQTVADIVSHINAVIAASGVTLTYGAVSKLITIAGAGVVTFTTQNINNGKTLFTMLGFDGINSLTGSNSYVGTSQAKLQYTRFIILASYAFSHGGQMSSGGATNIPSQFMRLPIGNLTPGDLTKQIEYINFHDVKYKYNPTKALGTVDLYLYDEFGLPLEPFIGDFYLSMALFSPAKTEDCFNL